MFSLLRLSFLCDVWCHLRGISVSFWGHFGVILSHFGALGGHWATPGSQDTSRVDSGSILGSLWEPLGHPSGSLFGPFGRPGGPTSEKHDASESVCSRARFLIGFSSLFGCLGPLKPQIPYGMGIQNHSFDRDRKNHDLRTYFGVVLGTI